MHPTCRSSTHCEFGISTSPWTLKQCWRRRLIAPFLLASAAFAQANLTSEIYKLTSPATVLIKTDKGGGSGFIVSSDGLIVTAYHVVDGVARVHVRTAGGDYFDELILLAKDERKDIAVLRVPGFDLATIPFGNSNEVQPGERVIVLGTPLAAEKLQASISEGIVSGIRDFGWGYKVIQITAAISPGNSGGPVLSATGNVIGVAAFKLTAGESLNFAVPINYVRGLIDALDKSAPLHRWKSQPGPDTVFEAKAPGKLTGYWKSSNGPLFYIQDFGNRIKILNASHPEFTYDARWESDLVLGEIYGAGIRRFVLRQIDSDHLHCGMFDYKAKDAKDVVISKARKSLQKPSSIWIKMQ